MLLWTAPCYVINICELPLVKYSRDDKKIFTYAQDTACYPAKDVPAVFIILKENQESRPFLLWVLTSHFVDLNPDFLFLGTISSFLVKYRKM